MEEITGFRTFTHMWKHIFDYKGTASRKEYWIPFAIHVGIGAVAGLFAILAIVGSRIGFAKAVNVICTVLAIILTIYLIVSVVPWISLTVRRLHDTGKSGWWTFLLLAVGIGTIILLFFCSMAAGASSFRPGNNYIESVYGPPEYFDPSYNVEEDVYGPPEFDDYDPYDNVEPAVYGPPEMFYDDSTRPDDDEIEIFVPDDNMEVTVYGPPEMMDDSTRE